MSQEDFKHVKIPSETYLEIKKLVEQSLEFGTVEDFINFVLREILFGDKQEISRADEDLLKKRMRDLGYL